MIREIKILIDRTRTDLQIRSAIASRKWHGYGGPRVLIVNEEDRISRSQIFPFHYYSDSFRQVWGAEFRQVEITGIDVNNTHVPEDADLIFFQPWFRHGADKMIGMIELLKKRNPNAKIVFFDVYAPLDLRFANDLNHLIDFYVKKHFFKDRSRYGIATQGDTNLVDYYEKLYGLPPSPETLFPIPQDFFPKLVLGPNFFTSREMLTTINSGCMPLSKNKQFGVHARLGGKGSSWYQTMREHASMACESYGSGGVVSLDYVRNRRYMRELAQSRICFSPFGYGELCWRDYEAIVCGALLVKPDMSHIVTEPDIFVPYETYVPVAWDFSDLSEKLDYYLANDTARQKIADHAYSVLYDYASSDSFLNQFKVIFNQGA